MQNPLDDKPSRVTREEMEGAWLREGIENNPAFKDATRVYRDFAKTVFERGYLQASRCRLNPSAERRFGHCVKCFTIEHCTATGSCAFGRDPIPEPTASDNERQLLRLAQWCQERFGVDTNKVIGTSGWPNTLAECVIQAADAARSASVPSDTARLDYMEGFIVEGTNPSTGKPAWLADADCIRDTIDGAIKDEQAKVATAERTTKP